MAWMIVRQPDSQFARWSDVIDNFTNWGMTLEEAELCCYSEHNLGFLESICRVQRALIFPERWDQCLQDIETVHGYEEMSRTKHIIHVSQRSVKITRPNDEMFKRLRSIYSGLYLCPYCEGRGQLKDAVPCLRCNQMGWLK